jgi:DNA modification methylase
MDLNNKLFLGNNVDIMKSMPNNCIDLTVTSPPYDNIREYNKESSWNFDIFKKVANELFRITKDGGVVVWVVADATIDGSETLTSFKQAIYFNEIGFKVNDTMIYGKKGTAITTNVDYRYLQSFEYVFVLAKGKIKTFNPIKELKNYKVYGRYNSRRKKDGSLIIDFVPKTQKKSIGNIWFYTVGGNTKYADDNSHPAVMPLDLALHHILSWSNENDLVFDPFLGAGTTAISAMLSNRKYCGIEISESYLNAAKKRISNAKLDYRKKII